MIVFPPHLLLSRGRGFSTPTEPEAKLPKGQAWVVWIITFLINCACFYFCFIKDWPVARGIVTYKQREYSEKYDMYSYYMEFKTKDGNVGREYVHPSTYARKRIGDKISFSQTSLDVYPAVGFLVIILFSICLSIWIVISGVLIFSK